VPNGDCCLVGIGALLPNNFVLVMQLGHPGMMMLWEETMDRRIRQEPLLQVTLRENPDVMDLGPQEFQNLHSLELSDCDVQSQ
jgi:hypothetical protein